MPRSIWNGTIAFGAVAVPVKLYSAVESRVVHFREVHLDDGAGIEHRTFCSKEDKEVPRDEVVRGFEVRAGRHVVLDKEDVDAAGAGRARIIDVERFVPGDDIDPVFYDTSYFVGARDEGGDAYRLLHDALERTGRVAIGRFTFHGREYLVAVRPYERILVLHTIRFADALVTPKNLDVPAAGRKPQAREVEMARQLVTALHEPFRPAKLHDEYREVVLEAVRRKAKGEDVAEAAPDDEDGDDLLAALEASLGSRGKASRRRSGTKAVKA